MKPIVMSLNISLHADHLVLLVLHVLGRHAHVDYSHLF
jgi:hypothetical protein